jgi:hypothetical protein
MVGRKLERSAVILFAIAGGAFLFFWSVPSSVDFLLRMRHRSESGLAQRQAGASVR